MHRPAPELLPGRSLRPRLESGNHRERIGRMDRKQEQRAARPSQDSVCNKAIKRIRGGTEDGNGRATRYGLRAYTDPKSRRHVATEHEYHLNSLDRILRSHQKPTQVGQQSCRTRAGILFVLFPRAEKRPSNSDSRRPQGYFLRKDLAHETWHRVHASIRKTRTTALSCAFSA